MKKPQLNFQTLKTLNDTKVKTVQGGHGMPSIF